MSRITLALSVVVFTLASLAQPNEAAAANGSKKILVCHVPPGNPDNLHEIHVSQSASDAHLAHGDYLGECVDAGKVEICWHGKRGDETMRVRPFLAAKLMSQGAASYGACGAEPEPTCDELDSDSDGADDCSDLCPDTIGEADADGCDCDQRGDCDTDGDGVLDRDDVCPGTPEGDEVYTDGCTVITLSAFAGPDVDAVRGDIVDVVGQGFVLTGDPGELVYVWEQVEGDPVDFSFTSPPLTVDTEAEGELVFRLTVSTLDGSASASDEFTILVESGCYTSDFEAGAGSEWSRQNTDRTPFGDRGFLGQFGNDTATLSLDGLPDHSGVTVSFKLFVIRSWDGTGMVNGQGLPLNGPDRFRVVLDGSEVFIETFSNVDGSYAPAYKHKTQSYPDGGANDARVGATETHTLGYGWKDDDANDCVYDIKLDLAHSSPAMVLDLVGMLTDSGGVENESWGIDDIEVCPY